MLSGVAVVADLTAALDLVATRPQLRAVTADGDLVGAGWVSGGSDRKPSTLEIASEVEKARNELAAAEKQVGELSAALSGALAEQTSRQDSAEQALAALNESDAAISAIYEQLGRLGQDARAADDEWQRLIQQRNELEAGRTRTVEELAELEQRLHNAQQEPTFESEPVDRQESMAAAEEARTAEVEARLTVRTAEERANAVRGRADSLRRAAAAEREARLRAKRAREARVHAAAVAAAVAESGRVVAQRLGAVVSVASRIRDRGRHGTSAAGRRTGPRPRRGQRARRQDRLADRRAASRRSRESPSGTAYRATRTTGSRAVRDGDRGPGRRVRARRCAAAVGSGDGRVRAGPRTR